MCSHNRPTFHEQALHLHLSNKIKEKCNLQKETRKEIKKEMCEAYNKKIWTCSFIVDYRGEKTIFW